MTTLTNSTRAAVAAATAAAAVAAILVAPAAVASSGLVLKLLDGSVPVDAPDLFASAYTKAWAGGNNFCSALKALLATNTDMSNAGCTAPAYGNTGVVASGSLGAELDFTATISVTGTIPFDNKKGSCDFTDTIDVHAQDKLSLSEPAQPPKVPSLSLAPPALRGSLIKEEWAPSCSSAAGNHPGSQSDFIVRSVSVAASNVNFPGTALSGALSPYQAAIEKDLTSMVYSVSSSTGDVNIQVLNSFLHQELGRTVKPNWETPSATPAPSTALGASAANRGVGSISTTTRPQIPATPSSLGGAH